MMTRSNEAIFVCFTELHKVNIAVMRKRLQLYSTWCYINERSLYQPKLQLYKGRKDCKNVMSAWLKGGKNTCQEGFGRKNIQSRLKKLNKYIII